MSTVRPCEAVDDDNTDRYYSMAGVIKRFGELAEGFGYSLAPLVRRRSRLVFTYVPDYSY